jgi:hypothetical protein
MMGLRTDTLNTEAIWGEIEAIANFFQKKGIREVSLSYGFSCRTSEIYVPIKMPVSEILPFIQRSIHEGIYQVGRGELHIEGGSPPMLFVLCHAGDIHFESDADSANREVERVWSDKGYRLHYYPA